MQEVFLRVWERWSNVSSMNNPRRGRCRLSRLVPRRIPLGDRHLHRRPEPDRVGERRRVGYPGPRRPSVAPGPAAPAWSPDGSHLAYISTPRRPASPAGNSRSSCGDRRRWLEPDPPLRRRMLHRGLATARLVSRWHRASRLGRCRCQGRSVAGRPRRRQRGPTHRRHIRISRLGSAPERPDPPKARRPGRIALAIRGGDTLLPDLPAADRMRHARALVPPRRARGVRGVHAELRPGHPHAARGARRRPRAAVRARSPAGATGAGRRPVPDTRAPSVPRPTG